MLNSGQLLRLIAVIAVLLLVWGRDVGACRAILVFLAVIIVCGCVNGYTAPPIAPVATAPYYGGRCHC
ncbi:hypothetical protein [Clostridium sp. DJ247]|uniref:hypothetical protein n=1 Tax=Clostridium sp. DJ247 TaxID=2726188 RepID=UPI001623D2C8|nr:hypothetical protein [Clostridium sp. DJ247]MBC2579813.1 hypothetical protein [Clostridium sp. DJ247]